MKNKPAPIAYSYLRFSSAEQSKGDSIRRQVELRDAWLARNHAALDTTLSLRDEGKSAFTGEHRKNPDRHALAAFLAHVEKGRIPRGSYLIVENLDRLSREHIQPALILFLSLLQAGVRVVQLLPVEQVYDDKSESMAIMMAIMELSRGNSESRMKSERIGRAWSDLKRRAAADKKPITPVVPAWLKVEGGKVVKIPERAAVVKRIFALVTAGHGLIRIATMLSTEGVPTFGRSKVWNPSTVYKVAHSRAAVGEYQPRTKKGKQLDGDPIPGYFPAVVTDAQWWAAQASLKGRHEGGRRTIRSYNPFAGLLTDARDGEKLYAAGPGKRKDGTKRMNALLVNYGATRGKPGAKFVSFPLGVFTRAVLSQLREIDPADVTGEAGEPDRVAELTGRVADLDARVAAIQAELEGGADVRAAVESLRKMEARRDALVADLVAERARASTPLAASLADAHTLIDLFNGNDTDDTRARLRAAIRRVVGQVVCLFVPLGELGRARVAAVQVWFKDADRHRDYLIAYKQGVGNAQRKQEARWTVRALALPGAPDGFDLRKKAHARKMEKMLAGLDPADVLG